MRSPLPCAIPLVSLSIFDGKARADSPFDSRCIVAEKTLSGVV